MNTRNLLLQRNDTVSLSDPARCVRNAPEQRVFPRPKDVPRQVHVCWTCKKVDCELQHGDHVCKLRGNTY